MTQEEHFDTLHLVFQQLRSAGLQLQLKPKKCDLLRSSVEFLGHLIDTFGVHTDSSQIQKEWPTPQTVREVRSFVGLTSYYRRYVQDYAKIARPLHQLTKQVAIFLWTEECQQAFQQLKTALVSRTLMAYPQRDEDFILDTAMLTQLGYRQIQGMKNDKKE